MAVIYDKNEYSVYPSSGGDFYDFSLKKNNPESGILRVEKLLYELPEDKASIVLKNTVFIGSEIYSVEKDPEKIRDIDVVFENNEKIEQVVLNVDSGAKVSVRDNEGVCAIGSCPVRVSKSLVMENNKNFKIKVDIGEYLSSEPFNIEEAVIKNCTMNKKPVSNVVPIAMNYCKNDVFKLFIKDVYIDETNAARLNLSEIFLNAYLSKESPHNYHIEGVKLTHSVGGIQCYGGRNVTLKDIVLEEGASLHFSSQNADILASNYTGGKMSNLHLVLSENNNDHSIFLKNCSSAENSILFLTCEKSDNMILENIGTIYGKPFKTPSYSVPAKTKVFSEKCDLVIKNIEELNLAGYFTAINSFRIESCKKVDMHLNDCQQGGKEDNSLGRITLDAVDCDNLIFKGNPTQIYGETTLIAKGANIDVRKLALLSVNTEMYINAKEGDSVKMRDVDAAGKFEVEGSANLNFVHMSQYGNNLKVCDSTLKNVIFVLEGNTITKTEIRDSNLEDVKIKNKTAGKESTVDIIQSDIAESTIRENCRIEYSELRGADLQLETKTLEFFHHSKVRTKLEGNLCDKALSYEKNKPAKAQAEAHAHINKDELEL